MSLNADQVVDALRAAGEPTRLRILALLAREELAVMELCQILNQSQPRVSRHLKLLAEAGLIERFPDGAWVFYRLAGGGAFRALIDEALGLISTGEGAAELDAVRLEGVRRTRAEAAAAYFTQNAARWDQIRSLYLAESEIEAAIVEAAGEGPYERLVDLGSGTGRMLTLLGKRAKCAVGLDLSHQMLNIARSNVSEAGLAQCELRHGDIFDIDLPDASADLVIVHQVLHYLVDPAAAVKESARLIGPGGRLLIVDFAPHKLEFLREDHQHRRLGFTDAEIKRWVQNAGLGGVTAVTLPPKTEPGLTVKIWSAERATKKDIAA
jgi:ubiquinone/menaquinone biosynthesis C-methylase UbiE/DNA-binding transcriptional ArsR family regulator